MDKISAVLLSLLLSIITMQCTASDNKKLAAKIEEDIKLHSFGQLTSLRDQLAQECFGMVTGHVLFANESEDVTPNPESKISSIKQQIVQLALIKNESLQKNKQNTR